MRGRGRRDPDPRRSRLHVRVPGRAAVSRRSSGADRRWDRRDHEGDHRQVVRPLTSPVLFAGCTPEVAAFDGRIVAVGAKARAAAGRKAEVVRLRGDAWPGLIDSHIHLESLIDRKLAVDLTGAKDLGDVLGRTREWVKPLPKDAWVVGSGWYNDAWPSAAFPTRRQLDAAVGGRPAYLERKDGHSAWVSTAALRAAGIDVASENPPGGAIDRDGDGAPTGILRETAMDMVLRLLPTPSDADLDAAMTAVLRDLAALGLTSPDLVDLVERCARAELNVCLHAIGDGAVRRALDALAPHRHAWSMWRPRIEHAQCVNPKDMTRMARLGVIASMQPIHALADRELADAMWPDVTKHAYAWRALERAGVKLAFGSDAPVETADPLAGIEAATAWRREAKWHPELALTRASALRAYTSGAAYATGMERDLGTLRSGKLCDMTVVDDGHVVATLVGGRVTWRRKPA